MISKDSAQALFYPLVFFLVISIVSHYFTGDDYVKTCERIYAITNYDRIKFEELLGTDLSTKCIKKWTKPD